MVQFLLRGSGSIVVFLVLFFTGFFVPSVPALDAPTEEPYLSGLVQFQPQWGVTLEDVPQPAAKPYIWPVSGPISKYFAPNHPLGIDIGLATMPGQIISAVAPGRVTFAGGDPCCSYGLYVEIDHGDGMVTLYAHLSRIDVREGDFVEQGRHLGISGDTGLSTAEHLHFEMMLHDEYVDPLAYLPPPACEREDTYYKQFASPTGLCPPNW